MGNDTFQLRCFRETNFTDQLINILCREGEELKPFYRGGGQFHLHSNFFVVNWPFSNIDLEMEKTHLPVIKMQKKKTSMTTTIRSIKWTGKLSQVWHILQLFNLSVWIYQVHMKPKWRLWQVFWWSGLRSKKKQTSWDCTVTIFTGTFKKFNRP